MLHGFKVAISGRGGKTLLESDQRVKEADKILTDLQRWFPQLQAAIDENEKTWAKLGYNMCTISKTAQEILDEENEMHYTLHSLYGAGESVLKPLGSDVLDEQRSRSNAELRSFNDSIRALRGLQQECVASIRNKEYYTTKVESMRISESKKKNRMTDREAERRLRNEEKLNEFKMQVNFKADKLQVELEKVLSRKQHVLDCALTCYVRTQDMFFCRNPMAPVITLLSHVSQASPRGVQDVTSRRGVRRMATFHGVVPSDADMPPRAPSPVIRVASAGPAVSSARSRRHGGSGDGRSTVRAGADDGARRQEEALVTAAAATVAGGVVAAVVRDTHDDGDSDDRERPAAYPTPTAL